MGWVWRGRAASSQSTTVGRLHALADGQLRILCSILASVRSKSSVGGCGERGTLLGSVCVGKRSGQVLCCCRTASSSWQSTTATVGTEVKFLVAISRIEGHLSRQSALGGTWMVYQCR